MIFDDLHERLWSMLGSIFEVSMGVTTIGFLTQKLQKHCKNQRFLRIIMAILNLS